ncbi:hypothetical protein HanXRQr2_Chr03g0113701 [Helianthus annuus]|uniref:Uncharacterized protein n=1 Tax=Helianthus annuus TaxID=4232 RepID=A0A9K3NWJ2_HELAN|nr:hypothetical protein HanXRQr2_Chr03g0113701 [Helianthus annuus]KAJ0943911.1 hypothetical protein HanPSC8_Chr03g0110141 [Helianthus annuus]
MNLYKRTLHDIRATRGPTNGNYSIFFSMEILSLKSNQLCQDPALNMNIVLWLTQLRNCVDNTPSP